MKTYRIFVCFDSRDSQSGWISAHRRKQHVIHGLRFQDSSDLKVKLDWVKNELIDRYNATHFKISLP